MGAQPTDKHQLWILDPEHSTVEFSAATFWGALTVKGRFARYHASLDLRSQPVALLTVETSSLDTRNKKRDRHLRSADFFDCVNHPHLRFRSDSASLTGDGGLHVVGSLECAGESVPIDLRATLRTTTNGLEIEAVTDVDQRQLGMHWSPAGMLRSPSHLTVRGRLIQAPPGSD